jgi:hypothetical protein
MSGEAAANVIAIRKDDVVALEAAETEFDRMCVSRRVDIDIEAMEPGDRAMFLAYKRQVVDAIRRGALVVAQDGTPTFSPASGDRSPIVFYQPTGATYMAMDAYSNEKGMMRTVAALTEMTRSAKGAISKLEAADFQICTSLANLFLSQR